MFGWCSWLSRQSNTLKVPSSILGSNTLFFFPPYPVGFMHPDRPLMATGRPAEQNKTEQNKKKKTVTRDEDRTRDLVRVRHA